MAKLLQSVLVLALAVFNVFAAKINPDPKAREIALNKYDKGAYPYEGHEDLPLEVSIPKLTVTSIDVDEKNQIFEVKGWLMMQWTDKRLAWGQNNRGYIHYSSKEVWTPDIAVYNSAKPREALNFYGNSEVLVNFNGSAIWVPPISFSTHCELDLKKWPYDTQTCVVALGSWTYDDKAINVTLGEDEVTLIDVTEYGLLDNTEWALESTNVKREAKEYACCPGDVYPNLSFEFTISRHSGTYCYTVVLPILMITLLNILIFVVPRHRGERVGLGMLNFLVVVLFLIYFSKELPMLNSAPAMVLLYGANLFFIVVILGVAVLTISFTDGSHACGTPKWTHWIFNRTVASALCLKNLQKLTNAKREGRSYSIKGTAGNGSVAVEEPLNPENKSPEESNKAEWNFLAAVLDRVILIDYILFSVIVLIYVHL